MYCSFIGCEIKKPCSATSCIYNCDDSKHKNCLKLFYYTNEGNVFLLDVAKKKNVKYTQYRKIRDDAVQKIASVIFGDLLIDKIEYIPTSRVCVVCETLIPEHEAPLSIGGGYSLCSKECCKPYSIDFVKKAIVFNVTPEVLSTSIKEFFRDKKSVKQSLGVRDDDLKLLSGD